MSKAVSTVPDAAPRIPEQPPTPARVALINMPFAMADRPSIQCGLLKSGLTQLGHDVRVYYLNLEFAAAFGHEWYREVAHLRTEIMLGEWLFSVAAFGSQDNEAEYRDICLKTGDPDSNQDEEFERLRALRNDTLPAWVDGWVEQVDWGQYDAVGFTSTFEQNTPAFALARAIKARHPEVITIFGGANFDGGMGEEYVRVLPFIDYAVTGEGDRVLPAMIARIADQQDCLDIPGVIGRRPDGDLVSNKPSSVIKNLDEVPDPNYDEYFETLFRLGRDKVLGNQAPLIMVETARGCWWGEKQHCTFCGLNSNGMVFRAKTPERAANQLRQLASKYKVVNFEAVDNIMDYKYLEKLCVPLAEEKYDYRIFYEVKANLTAEQLKLMSRAGINSIQPGIESLNSHILKLMRKGITMLRNVRLLKWAYYYGMRVGWNILTGFPGEKAEDYEEQMRLMPLLRHLPPPSGGGQIWLERFSPYFFDESFPVHDVKPVTAYRFIYPKETFELDKLAYFFSYRMEETLPAEFHQGLYKEIEIWKEAWEKNPRPVLLYQRAPDWIQVIDRRFPKPKVHAFSGKAAEVYEYCGETDRSFKAIRGYLASMNGGTSEDELQGILDEYCELGLMLREKNRYLSLALPTNPNW